MEGKMDTVPTTDEEGPGGMAYYKNPRIKHDLTLPLRTSPTRFAVTRRDGITSNAWGVYVDKKGEIYIACRDHMKTQKISLHKSGKRHIAFLPSFETTKGDRFLDEWWEPEYDGDYKMVPTFNLFFPSWALCLTQEIRNTNPVWDTNQIYIEAVESPMATIVSFCITDAGLTVRFRTIGDSPSVPLAILPVQPGKKLWVIARHVPEGKMKEWADIGIRHFNARLAVDANLVEKLSVFPSGHVMGLCASGNTSYGGKYMMPFPVDLYKNGIEGTLTDP